MSGQTGIAFIGTGFVADYYMTTLANHPQLRLAGVWDIDAARLQQFRSYYDKAARHLATRFQENFEQFEAAVDEPVRNAAIRAAA